jgi:small subunit ribosomal protein S18
VPPIAAIVETAAIVAIVEIAPGETGTAGIDRGATAIADRAGIAPARSRASRRASGPGPARRPEGARSACSSGARVCRFCADKRLSLDYKEAKTLRLFITETGKMIPRRISGNCAKHQRQLAVAIKRARQIALLPYAAGHM